MTQALSRSDPDGASPAPAAPGPGAERKRQRADLLASDTRVGADLCEPLTAQAETWLGEVWNTAARTEHIGDGRGWALVATAGTARRQLCPGSDLDVLLLHPPSAPADVVAVVAEALWYPLWDAGLSVSALVHTPKSVLELASRDLVTATTLLEIAHVHGDASVTADIAQRAEQQWQRRAKHWLRELAESVQKRHHVAGEVAFLLEPELREGRGGLRDVHALRWARRSGWPGVDALLAPDEPELAEAERLLRSVRVELHRTTGRRGDRLLLQEQDAVAAALHTSDADVLARSVSGAARTIAWCSDRFWTAVTRTLDRRIPPRLQRRQVVGPDIAVEAGQLVLRAAPDPADHELLLRVAAGAAEFAAPLSREALLALQLHAAAPEWPDGTWSSGARRNLVAFLGSGDRFLHVVEDLDRFGLMSRILPEWESVRAKPQRNAYHRFTVDRHLCQAAANASALVRTVSRPDLLLVGTWLHDIGKGFPGDHTEVGMDIVRAIGMRMGFDAADVGTLVGMEEHHLLLPEVATRRDLSDPATIELVAATVGDVDLLELLRALTIADSLATGPSAWSDWKARLVDDLVRRTRAVLGGHRPPAEREGADPRHAEFVDRVRADGLAHVVLRRAAVDGGLVTFAAPDRPGVFALFAGVLSLHGLDVVSADAASVADDLGTVAIDDFTVTRRLGGETDWRRVERDVRAALAGTLDLETRLAERVRTYASVPTPAQSATPPRAEVLVDDRWSSTATVIEVRAPDGIAALYRMTSVLAAHGVDIRTAKVATLGHEVVDVFYVRPLDAAATNVVADALRSELGA